MEEGAPERRRRTHEILKDNLAASTPLYQCLKPRFLVNKRELETNGHSVAATLAAGRSCDFGRHELCAGLFLKKSNSGTICSSGYLDDPKSIPSLERCQAV